MTHPAQANPDLRLADRAVQAWDTSYVNRNEAGRPTDSAARALATDLAAGVSPLRLVRLRLTLSLLAMAILPLAIAAPLAYSIVNGQQATDRLRAERDSTAVAAALSTSLTRTQESVVRTAAGTIVSGLLGTPARTSVGTARAAMLTLDASADDGITDAALIDANDQVRIHVIGGRLVTGGQPFPPDDPVQSATLALQANNSFTSPVHANPAGTQVITIAAPIPGADGQTAVGVLRVDVSLAQILGSGANGLTGGSALAQLIDSSGNILSEAHGTGAVVPTDGTVATATVPGFDDWRVQVSEPAQSSSTPYVLLGGLALLAILLGGIILWMARQILHPAEELEASRGRLRQLYEVARLDALRDALTTLGNHRGFHEELNRQLEFARRYEQPLSLVLIDLDDFKLVNDTSGHAAGDELLTEMGRLTLQMIRTTDRAFRIGGDEFAILMPHTDAEGARVVSRRLLASALETRSSSMVQRSFSCSMGISTFPTLARDKRQLQAQADSALYWCKAHGRTMVQTFDPDRHRDIGLAGATRELSSAIAELTNRHALKAVYQPIVELKSGRVIGYEGLVRPLPDSGFSNAGELFAAAEVTGRQAELDQSCIDVVIAGAKELAADTILSLNLSPRTLESPEFSVSALIRQLERHGITPNRTILELTERESVDDLDRLRQNVAACHAAGLRLAADDVGAGNAGLRLLSQMQFDIVKIDLSLVQGGTQLKTSLAVVSSLQELAQRWGAWVIAEGVETAEQLELIRGLGISAGQGYLLGRPGDALDLGTVDLTALLNKDDWLHRLARTAQPMSARPSHSA